MKRLVTNPEGKSLFTIEVVPSVVEDQEETYRPPIQGARGVNEAVKAVEDIGSAISEACQQIVCKVRQELSDISPDELELTFGVAIGIEGGLPMITRAHGDANFEVRALWRKGSE